MASSGRRSSCSFVSLLLSLLNLILLILSGASLAPTMALRMPPSSLGWALVMISGVSVLSSLVGFYSQLTHMCFISHVSLVLASSAGQLLGILALFTKEKPSLAMLRSPRDPREAKVLVRLECGLLMAMFVMQLGVLLLSCVVQSCCLRDYEADKDTKRPQKIARVQEDKMINKYGKWMENA